MIAMLLPMIRLRALSMLAASIFLAGCGTPTYYAPGRTQAQFDAQAAACSEFAGSSINQQNLGQSGYMMGQSAGGGGAALGVGGLALALLEGGAHSFRFDECMRSGGYTKASPPVANVDDSYQRGQVSQLEDDGYKDEKNIVVERGYCNESADCIKGLSCSRNTCLR